MYVVDVAAVVSFSFGCGFVWPWWSSFRCGLTVLRGETSASSQQPKTSLARPLPARTNTHTLARRQHQNTTSHDVVPIQNKHHKRRRCETRATLLSCRFLPFSPRLRFFRCRCFRCCCCLPRRFLRASTRDQWLIPLPRRKETRAVCTVAVVIRCAPPHALR